MYKNVLKKNIFEHLIFPVVLKCLPFLTKFNFAMVKANYLLLLGNQSCYLIFRIGQVFLFI